MKILIYFFLFWIFGIISIVYNPRNKATRFSSLAALFGGCGGLADAIKLQLIPLISKYLDSNVINSLLLASGILDSLAFYGAPYCLLIFSILYSEILNTKKKYYFYLIHIGLLISILLMYTRSSVYPEFLVSFKALLIWATPYFLISDALLIYSVIIAKDRIIKKQRFLTCLLLVPLVTILFITNYVGVYIEAIPMASLSRYNDTIGVVLLFGFILLAARYGFLGVKIEVSNIDDQMKTATLGINLINHSIKNELAKIKICIKNLSSSITPNPVNKESLQIIDGSFNHIFNMMSRIQLKTQTIVINKESSNLLSLIDTTLSAIHPLLQNRNIEIVNKIETEIKLMIDKVHFQEVLFNSFKNAIEAIPISQSGRIEVNAKCNKKQIIIEISDNGSGISKEVLPHVFEPFFSTKHLTDNYGLGLSYSLNVLQKSGGTIEIQSEPNNGTIVLLKLPNIVNHS